MLQASPDGSVTPSFTDAIFPIKDRHKAPGRPGANMVGREIVVTKLPVGLLLTAAVSLGLTLGWFYLHNVRKPMLIGLHLLLGAGALESLAVLLHSSHAADAPGVSPGIVAASLVAWSLFSGLIRPLFAEARPKQGNALLVTHAAAGLTGFFVFLFWTVHK